MNKSDANDMRIWVFQSLKKDGKYFTLAGNETIDPYYTKLAKFSNLTDPEKTYILDDYFKLKDKIKKAVIFFQEYVLWDEPI